MTGSYDEESATVSVKGYGMINDATQLKQYLDRAKRINVLGGVTKIDRNVFTDCGNVEEVILPDGFLSVGDNSFSMSKSLKTINFPDTLESIGNEAFMSCSSLENVTIPKTVFRAWQSYHYTMGSTGRRYATTRHRCASTKR